MLDILFDLFLATFFFLLYDKYFLSSFSHTSCHGEHTYVKVLRCTCMEGVSFKTTSTQDMYPNVTHFYTNNVKLV